MLLDGLKITNVRYTDFQNSLDCRNSRPGKVQIHSDIQIWEWRPDREL